MFREGPAVDQAIQLAKVLGLTKVINKLPDGLDTRIGGSNSDSIPAGIRQQIILVRSMIGGSVFGTPKIILFDDANSCLDFNNEAKLHTFLQNNRKNRTLIIISHRPSLLAICDRHFEIKNGVLESQDYKFSQSNVGEALPAMSNVANG